MAKGYRPDRYLVAGTVTTAIITGIALVLWNGVGGAKVSTSFVVAFANAAAFGVLLTLVVFLPTCLVVRAVVRERAARIWLPPTFVTFGLGLGLPLLIHVNEGRIPEPQVEIGAMVFGVFLGVLQAIFSWITEPRREAQSA